MGANVNDLGISLKPLNILSIDPGEKTGVARFAKGDFISSHTFTERELKGYCQTLVSLRSYLDYVVIEEFRLRSNKAKSLSNQVLYTPQLIGKLQEWCDGMRIVYQPSSVANGKRFFTVDKLKAMGLKWNSIHERDAITHGLFALTFNKEIK